MRISKHLTKLSLIMTYAACYGPLCMYN